MARAKRNAAEAENELLDADSDSEKEARIEHDRILGPEDFKRIKALRTAGQLGEALDRSGARKASATGAEEMRRMLRADKSAQADRRVNPDALAAVGLKRAHDKESRVASIMAGREDRGRLWRRERPQEQKGGRDLQQGEGEEEKLTPRRACQSREEPPDEFRLEAGQGQAVQGEVQEVT